MPDCWTSICLLVVLKASLGITWPELNFPATDVFLLLEALKLLELLILIAVLFSGFI